jgi:retinoid hydroxylase
LARSCTLALKRNYKPAPTYLVGFSGETRICIGIAFAKMEMKIIAAHFLPSYDWKRLPNQS